MSPEEERKLDQLVDTRGFSYDDAMRYLGMPVDDPRDLIEAHLRGGPRLAKERMMGQEVVLMCGDCGREVGRGSSCSHMRIGSRGKRYANDDSRFC